MPRFVNVVAAAVALASFLPHAAWAQGSAQETAGDYGRVDTPFIDAANAACEKGDVRGFWEAFVESEAVQERYSANYILTRTSKRGADGTFTLDSARYLDKSAYASFPITMIDYYWKPTAAAGVTPNSDDLYVELQFDQGQNEAFVVTWTVVRYDGLSGGGDDLGTPYLLSGEPYDGHTFGNSNGALAFVTTEGYCWELAEDLRFIRD